MDKEHGCGGRLPLGNHAFEELAGGHRGLTHSIPFAMVLGAAPARSRLLGPGWTGSRLNLWIWLSLVIASHGVLDTVTSYGAGVTLLAPFSWHRFKAPWIPIDGGGACQGPMECIMQGVSNELLWRGVPSLILLGFSILARRNRREAA